MIGEHQITTREEFKTEEEGKDIDMKTTKYIILGLLASAVLPGCIRDKAEWCPEADGSVLIELRMPDLTSTRAVDIIQDEAEYNIEVDDLYVLVFKDNGGDGSNDTFMYYTQPTGEVTNPNNPMVRTYTLPLNRSENSEKQRLVFIANFADGVEELLADPDLMTKTKSQLLQGLNFTYADWPDTPIPMWGESARSVIVIGTTTGNLFGDIKMVFAVAKIEVAVGADSGYSTANGVDNFKMSGVQVINYPYNGYVVPQVPVSDGVVARPSIPANAWDNTSGITDISVPTLAYGASKFPYLHAGPFYVMEAANKNAAHGDHVYLIVSGYYTEKGAVENTTTESYYRVDFYDRASGSSTVSYLDIKRGHRYMVNIKGTDGPGYKTPEEAAGSVTTKMNAQVTVWNADGIVTDITGEYSLSVSLPEFSFNGMARDDSDTNNKVGIFTDYSGGWNVLAVTDMTGGTEIPADWLSTDIVSGDPYVITDLSVNVTGYDSTAPRYGRIYIEAGKWTYIINVEQKLSNIDVSPSVVNLTFDHYQVPFAETELIMDTEFGWKLDRIEDEMGDPATWVSIFDPELEDALNIFKPEFDLQPDNLRSSEKAYIRAAANPGTGKRTAIIYFTNEEGIEASVTVNQGWIDCGVGGVPKTKTMGGDQVMTHIYGSNIRKIGESMAKLGYFRRMSEELGEPYLEQAAIDYIHSIPNEYAISCFMVENSRQGTYEFDEHPLFPEVIGPYYTPDNAASACPGGWRLPTGTDANNIAIPSEALREYGLHYLYPEFFNYWGEESYSGYVIKYYQGGEWYNDGYVYRGYWWGNVNKGLVMLDAFPDSVNPAGTTVNYTTGTSWYENYLCPVRCVEDQNPYNYPMRKE